MSFKLLHKSSTWETLVFIILLVYSIILSSERIILTDSSFYLFKLINFSTFNIELGRYSAFISQIPVALCIKMHVPLKYLIPIFSASFVILFYGIYLLLRFGLNNKEAATASALLSILGISHLYYQPVTELVQGFYFSLILYAYLYYSFPENSRSVYLKLIIPVLIIILCYFSHPASVFALLFISAFYLIDMKRWKTFQPYFLGMFILAIFSLKILLIKPGSYEGEKLSGIADGLSRTKDILNAYPTLFLFRRLFNLYLFHTLFLICLISFYFYKRQFLKILLVTGFIVLFLVIHNMSYFEGGSDIDMEKNMLTLSLFIFIPFIKDIFPGIRSNKYYLATFWIVLIIFSTHFIFKPRKIYTGRISYINELLETSKKQEGRKFFVYNKNIDRERIKFTWTSSIETLFCSSLKGPEEGRTIYVFNETASLPEFIKEPELFLMVDFWPRRNVSELNAVYFNLPMEEYKYLQLNNFYYSPKK